MTRVIGPALPVTSGIGGYKNWEAVTGSMQATESVKVPDGKLVRVELTYEETIEDVAITGDFFLEPPEALAALEAAIEGQPADVSIGDLQAEIEAVDAQLIGFDAADLATVTVEALE